MLQQHYQRGYEVPGTYATDFEHPEFVRTISLSAIQQAARLAIGTLEERLKTAGRPIRCLPTSAEGWRSSFCITTPT